MRSLALVIQHTVAVSLEIRVGYLVPEFLAHAFVLRGVLYPAGTVAPCLFKTLAHHLDYLFVVVFLYVHVSPQKQKAEL